MFKNSKLLKSILVGMSVVVAIGALAGCGSSEKAAAPVKKDMKKIGVVQLVEHAALDMANKGFVDGLAKRNYIAGKNVEFDQQNAQADQSNLQNISQRFVNDKVDLICAIATPAAQSVANATTTIPIVGTAITDYESAKLVKSNEKPGTNVTGTSDMNPIEAQIDLLIELTPNIKTMGLLYTSSEMNSQIQAKVAEDYAKSKGLDVKVATVSTVNDIQQAARSIVNDVEAIYVPTDNVLASAMPTLAAITDEAKIPVIAGAGTMVDDGGVATLAVDYYKLGLQTGDMAADILDGKSKPQDMKIETQKEFHVVLNKERIKKLGIKVPEKILKLANEGK
jgi:putative ABC transport system substrate-binding protein